MQRDILLTRRESELVGRADLVAERMDQLIRLATEAPDFALGVVELPAPAMLPCLPYQITAVAQEL